MGKTKSGIKVGDAGLTDAQAIFVQEYCLTDNGAASAIKAGYGVAGARVQACRMLQRPNIIRAVELERRRRVIKTVISADFVLANLKKVVINGLTVDPKNKHRFIDSRAATKALELLGKHLKLFVDRIEVEDLKSIVISWEQEQKAPDVLTTAVEEVKALPA